MDMGRIYREATRTALPDAAICFDPFHVIMWAGDALDQTHLATPRRQAAIQVDGISPAQAWHKVRSTLRAAAENLDTTGQAILDQLRSITPRCSRPGNSKNSSAASTAAPPARRRRLPQTLVRQRRHRSGINAFTALARRIGHNFDGITAAIHNGLSNSLTEGLNAGIRLIQRRAHGYANLSNLIEMIYLCHGGVPNPPTHQPQPIETIGLAHPF